MNSTLRKWTSLIALIGLLTTAIAPVTASAQSRYAPEWLIKPIAKPQMQVIAPSWLVEQEELLEDGSEDLVYEDETEEIDEEEQTFRANESVHRLLKELGVSGITFLQIPKKTWKVAIRQRVEHLVLA